MTKTLGMILVAGVLLLSIPGQAQEITGNISGTVNDPTGAAVPEAVVVVTDTLTGVPRSTVTTAAGVFFFTSLPIGNYRLTVEKAGFKKVETTGIHLDVNDKLDFPIVMSLGAVTENVTVNASAVQLQTETAEVSNLVSNAHMETMPLNGRNFSQLVDMVPGITPDGGRLTTGGAAISANGNLSNSNYFMVDGTFDQDNGNNGGLLVTPSVDSIEEFKILRNNYSAEFGSATGAQVNVITKAGTRQFHGSLFEFGRNDALDATNFFLNKTGTPKSELRQHDFGFTVGGPVAIPKLYNTDRTKDFFFMSGEYRRQIAGSILTDTVPTLRQRSGILDPNCVATKGGCVNQSLDPQEQVLDEPDVAGPFNPNAAAILSRYPLPNTSYLANGFNYIVSAPSGNNSNHFAIRWDHNISDKATLMFNIMKTNGTQPNRNAGWADDNFPNVNSDWTTTAKVATMKLVYTISPHTVNDFQFGYSNNTILFVTSKSSDPTLASRSGFNYTELFPETSGSFPAANFNDGFGTILHTAPFFNRTDNFQINDGVSHIFDRHNLKVGFTTRFARKREPANGGDDETAGNFTFDSLSDMLSGKAAQYTEEQGLNEVPSRGHDLGIYFQDTFKVRHNFTLDYGLRWQYLGQVYSDHNNISGFWPSMYNASQCSVAAFSNGLVDPAKCNVMNGIVTPATPGIVNRSLHPEHHRDFEPRVGFSWDPFSNHKLVLRSGVGVYHGRDAFSQDSSSGRQPPFDLIPQLNNIAFSQLTSGQLSPFNPLTPQPPVNMQVLDPVYKNPASYQYSMGIQYELMRDTTLEVNYVGSRQVHLGLNANINQVLPQDQLLVAQGKVDPNTVRPYLGFDIINMNQRMGTSRYNSMQVFLNRQLRHGVAIQAAYTLSRNITNTLNRDTESAASPVQDANNPNADKSVAPTDETHNFTMNYTWQVPFFRGAPALLKNVLGGWQANGITTFRTGLPLNVCLNQDNAGLGQSPSDVCERPQLVGNPFTNIPVGKYFNTAAFASPALGVFGNAGRDILRRPGYNNWDLSAVKEFAVPWLGKHGHGLFGETARMQLRGEFFNVWNHTMFSTVSSKLGPKSFGTITAAQNPRQVQLGARFVF